LHIRVVGLFAKAPDHQGFTEGFGRPISGGDGGPSSFFKFMMPPRSRFLVEGREPARFSKSGMRGDIKKPRSAADRDEAIRCAGRRPHYLL
jgi:hypothetical protein